MSYGDAVGEHTLTQRLDPASTALVIIDMQYASACRTTGFGRWLAEIYYPTDMGYVSLAAKLIDEGLGVPR